MELKYLLFNLLITDLFVCIGYCCASVFVPNVSNVLRCHGAVVKSVTLLWYHLALISKSCQAERKNKILAIETPRKFCKKINKQSKQKKGFKEDGFFIMFVLVMYECV